MVQKHTAKMTKRQVDGFSRTVPTYTYLVTRIAVRTFPEQTTSKYNG